MKKKKKNVWEGVTSQADTSAGGEFSGSTEAPRCHLRQRAVDSFPLIDYDCYSGGLHGTHPPSRRTECFVARARVVQRIFIRLSSLQQED